MACGLRINLIDVVSLQSIVELIRAAAIVV